MNPKQRSGGWFILDCFMVLMHATFMKMTGPNALDIIMMIWWGILAVCTFPESKQPINNGE